MDQIAYLESERIKLWEKVSLLEELIKNKTSDSESEARTAAKKAAEFRNRSKDAYDALMAVVPEINKTWGELKLLVEDNSKKSAEVAVLIGDFNSAKMNLIEDGKSIAATIERMETLSTTLDAVIEDIDEKKKSLAEVAKINQSLQGLQSKTDLLHKNSLERFNAIEECYLDINGYEEEDDQTGETKEIEGLRSKLEASFKDLSKKIEVSTASLDSLVQLSTGKVDTVEKKWDEQHGALKKKIEGLLPKALTAGLSHAYSNKKEEEVVASGKIATTFAWAIGGLTVVSLIPFGVSVYSLYHDVALNDVVARMPRLVLAIIPLYVPVMWIAYSANKKLNLSKRLIEEYTHKEVLSKTYEGLSRQIAEIGDDEISRDLRVKLLYNILEVSAENPGKLISDYNKSDHPLMDALDKSIMLTNAVEKLNRIPGFSKMAVKMKEKADKLIVEGGAKATQGMSMVED